ncbi:MAG TPA: hypothetical protein VJ938_13140, partial [Acidimicrobiia bacterium]|nr:hypothetical protein [Acidimicrobiia bacterium]
VERLKPLLALLLGAGLIVAGVVGLSRLTMDTSPPSTSVGAAPSPSGEGSTPGIQSDGPPNAEGGTLAVTGTEAGALVLTGTDRDAITGYTLSGPDGQITFGRQETGEVFIDHLIYNGMDFFLDPGECTVTEGDLNPDVGVVEALVSCPEITDLRQTATLTVQGSVGVASTLLSERDDLPETGGSVTVSGDLSLDFAVEDAFWVSYDTHTITAFPNPVGLYTEEKDGQDFAALEIDQNADGSSLWVGRVVEGPNTFDVPENRCPVGAESLGALSPSVDLARLTIGCTDLAVPDLGTISIEGSVVVTHELITLP